MERGEAVVVGGRKRSEEAVQNSSLVSSRRSTLASVNILLRHALANVMHFSTLAQQQQILPMQQEQHQRLNVSSAHCSTVMIKDER